MRAGQWRTSGRGTILVGVVCALIMLQLLVVGLTLGGARDHGLTVRRIEAARSFYAAEGAMNCALREVSLGEDLDLDGVIGGFHSDGPGDAPELGAGRGWVQLIQQDEQRYCLAEGTSGRAVHRIECWIE